MDKEKALKICLPVIADGVKDLPECKESLEMAIEALENQKTGHWILDEQSPVGGMYKCSECGRLLYRFREDNLLEKYPYCHCGAKMEGENNESNL